jgi:hypothetical protein
MTINFKQKIVLMGKRFVALLQVKTFFNGGINPMPAFDIDLRNRFLVATLLSTIYTFPLLFSGHYYMDDFGRSIYGYSGYAEVCRPLADILLGALYFGGPLPDISPIPQLLAVLILAATMALVSKKFTDEKPLIGIVACFPLISNPFYLENLSFKWDVLPMTLSVSMAILPFVLDFKKPILHALACFISVLAALCLYQASVNVFIAFAVLNFIYFQKLGLKKDSLVNVLYSAIGMFVAYLSYSQFIVPHILKNYYAIKRSVIAGPGIDEILTTLNSNYHVFKSRVDLALTEPAIYMLAPFFILMIGYVISLIFKKSDESLFIELLSNILLVLSPFVLILCIAGPMLLLESPVIAPRVFVGASALITSIFVISFWAIPHRTRFIKYLAILPIFYMFTIAYAYANVTKNQEKFEKLVISQMVSDLDSKSLTDANFVAFNGQMPYARAVVLSLQKYPILSLIAISSINNGWWMGYAQLQHYQIKQGFAKDKYMVNIRKNLCSFKLVKKTTFYNLYRDEDHAIFDFEKKACN